MLSWRHVSSLLQVHMLNMYNFQPHTGVLSGVEVCQYYFSVYFELKSIYFLRLRPLEREISNNTYLYSAFLRRKSKTMCLFFRYVRDHESCIFISRLQLCFSNLKLIKVATFVATFIPMSHHLYGSYPKSPHVKR